MHVGAILLIPNLLLFHYIYNPTYKLLGSKLQNGRLTDNFRTCMMVCGHAQIYHEIKICPKWTTIPDKKSETLLHPLPSSNVVCSASTKNWHAFDPITNFVWGEGGVSLIFVGDCSLLSPISYAIS